MCETPGLQPFHRRSPTGRPIAGTRLFETSASKRPVGYSPTRNGIPGLSDCLANIVGLSRPGVLCDSNQLDSSELRNVQIRGGPPAAAAIPHFHDDGYLHGFDASDKSKSVAAQHGIGSRKNAVRIDYNQQLPESFHVAHLQLYRWNVGVSNTALNAGRSRLAVSVK